MEKYTITKFNTICKDNYNKLNYLDNRKLILGKKYTINIIRNNSRATRYLVIANSNGDVVETTSIKLNLIIDGYFYSVDEMREIKLNSILDSMQ